MRCEKYSQELQIFLSSSFLTRIQSFEYQLLEEGRTVTQDKANSKLNSSLHDLNTIPPLAVGWSP